MRARSLIRSSFVALSLLCLSACNSGGDSDPVATPAPAVTMQGIVVAPSLGKIVGGGARAFDSAGNPLSEETDTGSSGFATLRIPSSYRGPVLIRMRGKPGATYFDESTGETEDFPEGQSFRAALPAPRASAGVSILTELAVRLAEASGQTLDAAAIEAANERVRAALAPEVADLLTAPALVDGATGAGDLDGSDAGKLAARLGALARLASGDATPALTMLQQLVADVADGRIDGLGADGEAIMTVYSPASFAADFVRAVQDFAGAFGDQALRTAARDARAQAALDEGDGGTDTGTGSEGGGSAGGETGSGNGGGTGSSMTQPGTVSSALVGSYTLVYFDASPMNASEPYADEQELSVTVTADGTLTIDDLVLTNPFNRFLGGTSPHLPEIIWLDPATNLEYALSDNERGTFNEINVGDATLPLGPFAVPTFLGQIREEEDENPATTLVAPLAATFSNLLVIDACRDADGALCPNGTAAGSVVDVIIGTDATITIGDVVIDPSSSDARVLDQRSSIEPRVTVNAPGAAADETFEVDIFVDPARAGSSSVNGFRVRLIKGSGGVFRSDGITLELTELRAQFTDFFAALVAATETPVAMTIIKDDDAYPSRMQQAVGFSTGTRLCRRFDLRAERDVMVSSTRYRQFVLYLNDDVQFEYTRASSRLRSAGPQWLSFQGGQLRRDRSRLSLEEGLLSIANGNFINSITAVLEDPLASVRDAASNDATVIDAACADFADLTVTILADGLTAGRLKVNDVSGAEPVLVFDGDFQADVAEPAVRVIGLPRDRDYEVVVDPLQLKSSPAQACSTERVTLGLDQALALNCTAPEEA